MREQIPGQGRTHKQYSDSMKIIALAAVTFLLSLFFISCTWDFYLYVVY